MDPDTSSSIVDSDADEEHNPQSSSSTAPSPYIIYGKNEIANDKDDRVTSTVVVMPRKEENWRDNNLILTLGENYFENSKPIEGFLSQDERSIRNYWGNPRKFTTPSDRDVKQYGLSVDKKYVKVPPRKTILTHTEEFIGLCKGILANFNSIPSLVASLITVNVGYENVYFSRCVLTITNNSDSCIFLEAGSPVAKVTFIITGPMEQKYKDVDALKTLMNTWNVETLVTINKN